MVSLFNVAVISFGVASGYGILAHSRRPSVVVSEVAALPDILSSLGQPIPLRSHTRLLPYDC